MVKTIKNIVLGLIPFFVILGMWQLVYYFQLAPHWLLPSPIDTACTFWGLLIDGTIFKLITLSAANAIPAFILALFLSITFGIFIGVSHSARKIFMPFLSAIYPIPSLVWLPLIVLFLGFTRQTIWCVIFISSFMKIIYCVISGVQGINYNWILAAKNLGISKIGIVFHVVIPGALPSIITGARMGFGSSWRALIGAEMLVASFGGLGKFIWMAQWFFDFDKVFAGIIAIAIIGLVVEKLIFGKLEKLIFIRWGISQEVF